ncbi:MAG: prepilin-type N-terminal cleavage/methylation domain-containing protein [Vulcanimicrobiota bacterium]
MKRGFSLVEVIVAAGLLAVSIPLLLNLLPTSFLSLRKAELMQQATSMALYRLDEAQFLTPRRGVDLDEVQRVGARDYRLVREFYQLDSQRWDVVVSCGCDELTPVRMATRLIREDS